MQKARGEKLEQSHLLRVGYKGFATTATMYDSVYGHNPLPTFSMERFPSAIVQKGTVLGTFEERCLYYTSPKMKYVFTDEELLYRAAFIFKRST